MRDEQKRGETTGSDPGTSAKEKLDLELSSLLGELSELLARPAPLAGLSAGEQAKINAQVDLLFGGIRGELETLREMLWPAGRQGAQAAVAGEEAEFFCGVFRKGSSKTFDQPGDEVFCCDCFEEIEYFDGPIKIIDRSELEPLRASDLGKREIDCTRCRGRITGDAARVLKGFSGAEEG